MFKSIYSQIESEILTRVKLAAMAAHQGQTRRDKVTPYFAHVEAVARRAAKYGFEYEIVAYLHDTLEERCKGRAVQPVTWEEMFKGTPYAKRPIRKKEELPAKDGLRDEEDTQR